MDVSPLSKVRKLWHENYDAYLIYKPEYLERRDLFYLTGFPGTTGFFFQAKRRNCLVVDSRYHGTAKFHAKARVEVLEVAHGESSLRAVLGCIKESRAKRIAVEDYVPVQFWNSLQANLPPKIRIEPVHGITLEARKVKSFSEIKAMRGAQRITDAIWEKLPKLIIPGMHTEYEVALLIEDEARKLGAERVSFPPIVAGGKHSARPHHMAGNDRIPKRGVLLFDFGVRYRGYCSDFSRTVWIGKNPEKKFRAAYKAVLAAHAAGVTMSKFTRTSLGKNIDTAARKIIDATEFKGTFVHGLGHGVGLEVHEGSSLSPNSNDRIHPGEVVTVEPGIYLSGKFGIRIEDMVIAGKGEILSRASRKLAVW